MSLNPHTAEVVRLRAVRAVLVGREAESVSRINALSQQQATPGIGSQVAAALQVTIDREMANLSSIRAALNSNAAELAAAVERERIVDEAAAEAIASGATPEAAYQDAAARLNATETTKRAVLALVAVAVLVGIVLLLRKVLPKGSKAFVPITVALSLGTAGGLAYWFGAFTKPVTQE